MCSRPSGTHTVTRWALVAAANSCAPSRTRCGDRINSSLSLSLAGSPSMALTTMVPPLPAAWATASLMAEGNPAPPRPANPEASSTDTNASCQPRAFPDGSGRGTERGHVAGQVGGVTEQPVATGGRHGFADAMHDATLLCPDPSSARCLGGTPATDACAVLADAWRDTSRSRHASAAATEATHTTPSTMTQPSRESVPMPKVWASATGQDR